MFGFPETKVVNKNYQRFDFYIGRGSKWGNPFIIGTDGSRTEVVEKYREYFKEKREKGEITDQDLLRLNGARLGCFCKPLPCHGDVIVEELNALLKKRKDNVF